MMNIDNRQRNQERAPVAVETGLSPARSCCTGVETFDDAVATNEEIETGKQIRRLRHELQLALTSLMAGACADTGALAASADISWVQDQVIERPYMAQVVNRWFQSVRQLSEGQVQSLRKVSQLIIRIEELAPAEALALARYRDALTPATYSG